MSDPYLERARENLEAARHAVEAGWPNVAASRAYYSAFLGAVSALSRAGAGVVLDHGRVAALFATHCTRRKMWPSALAPLLPELIQHRHVADYEEAGVSLKVARTCVARAEKLIAAVDPQEAT